MIRRTGRTLGFSLLELMNVISFVALLSTLGMYAVAKYVRHTKTAEAISSVDTIARGAAAYYNGSDFAQPAGSRPEALRASRHFPPPSRYAVPADARDVQGKRYKSSLADWQGAPWREIRFTMPGPQCYQYAFESDGAGAAAKAAAVARGDLDGNNSWAMYRLAVTPDAAGSAKVGAAIEKTNPEE